jgi:acyl carrier protein
MLPKMDGAWNLHLLTRNLPLDFFITFSSITSVFGWPGQGNYAAANGFLDALAHYRETLGLKGLNINWGPWAETGMAAELERYDRQRFQSKGLLDISPEDGFETLTAALSSTAGQSVALSVNWRQFARQFSGAKKAFFSDIISGLGQPVKESKDLGKDFDLQRRLAEAPPEQTLDLLIGHVEHQAASILGLSSNKRIDRLQPLKEMGLDSLLAVELSNALGASIGKPLPATLLFDYPSIQEVASYVGTKLFGSRAVDKSQKDGQTELHGEQKKRDRDIQDIVQISDAEAEALLQEELSNMRNED